MYIFKIESNLKKYDNFICQNQGQYIQSSNWQKVKTNWKCQYYCGYKNNDIVLAVLVMERTLPVVGKIWYAPSGAICDYNNKELIKEFTNFIRSEIKEKNITCFIMDPPISLRINGKDQENGHIQHRNLIDLGYKLNSSIENYTYKQPVQLFVPLKTPDGNNLSAEKILKNCDKGVRYSIRIGEQRGLVAKTYTYDDIEKDPQIINDFMSVMRDTSERDNFVERDGAYCIKLLKEFKDNSDLKLIYYDKTLDKKLQDERLQQRSIALANMEKAHEKKARQLNETITSIDKQTEHFEKRIAEANDFTSDNTICVAGGLSIYYAGMGSCLFGGTRNVIRNNTRSSHYLNYLRLCESINRGCEVHDLGYILVKSPSLQDDGTLGPLEAQENFKGIYNFKKSFSADYHEFIGEYILVEKKLRYFFYAKLMPIAKKAKIKLIKIIRK